jgi:hypothetical protein
MITENILFIKGQLSLKLCEGPEIIKNFLIPVPAGRFLFNLSRCKAHNFKNLLANLGV